MISFAYTIDEWPLKKPFSFAGYTIAGLDCVHAVVQRDGHCGQGEGVLPIVFDVTLQDVRDQLDQAAVRIASGQNARNVCAALPPGPARNALDCALWDLEAKCQGRSIWDMAGLENAPQAIRVDETIGLDTPEAMGQAARTSAHQVLKLKLDSLLIIERVQAVRRARPDAQLLVDANQSWSPDLLSRHGPELAQLGVCMIEQPLPRDADAALGRIDCPVPLFADESCHVTADLNRLAALYQGVNIKLDKTGGLTEALELARAARAKNMGVMVGCMAGTSLSMASAYVIGAIADWADLDGPLLLSQDRLPPMTYRAGMLACFHPALWG